MSKKTKGGAAAPFAPPLDPRLIIIAKKPKVELLCL